MAWFLLIGAGLLEIVWATALKLSEGLARFWPSAIAIVAAIASIVMLSIALKSLPVGTAYAVWFGIGAVGVALAGITFLGRERAFLALILIGIVGLRDRNRRRERCH